MTPRTLRVLAGALIMLVVVGASYRAVTAWMPRLPDLQEVRTQVITTLQQHSADERMLVSHVAHRTDRVVHTIGHGSKDAGWLSGLASGVMDGLYGKQIDALISTRVHLGYDLTDVSVEVRGETVEIRLPELEVVAVEIDHGASRVDTTSGWAVSTDEMIALLGGIYADMRVELAARTLADPDARESAEAEAERTLGELLDGRVAPEAAWMIIGS